jgi:hypothetical protein
MTKTCRLGLILIICTVLAACRIDANSILQPNENLTVQIYNRGATLTKKTITKNDKAYVQFVRWLKDNETGWSIAPATYAPSVEVRGKKFAINFHPTLAILNFQSPDGNYRQYSKEIKETDFQYLIHR